MVSPLTSVGRKPTHWCSELTRICKSHDSEFSGGFRAICPQINAITPEKTASNKNQYKSLAIVPFCWKSYPWKSFLRLLLSFTFAWIMTDFPLQLDQLYRIDQSLCHLNHLKWPSFVLCFVNGRLFISLNQYTQFWGKVQKIKDKHVNTQKSCRQIPWNCNSFNCVRESKS